MTSFCEVVRRELPVFSDMADQNIVCKTQIL